MTGSRRSSATRSALGTITLFEEVPSPLLGSWLYRFPSPFGSWPMPLPLPFGERVRVRGRRSLLLGGSDHRDSFARRARDGADRNGPVECGEAAAHVFREAEQVHIGHLSMTMRNSQAEQPLVL